MKINEKRVIIQLTAKRIKPVLICHEAVDLSPSGGKRSICKQGCQLLSANLQSKQTQIALAAKIRARKKQQVGRQRAQNSRQKKVGCSLLPDSALR